MGYQKKKVRDAYWADLMALDAFLIQIARQDIADGFLLARLKLRNLVG